MLNLLNYIRGKKFPFINIKNLPVINSRAVHSCSRRTDNH